VPFGPGDLLRVSEVGVAVGDVPTAVGGLERDLGLEVWNEPNEEFTTVGDEEGLLIVVKRGRPPGRIPSSWSRGATARRATRRPTKGTG
jgi:hypothetical protein